MSILKMKAAGSSQTLVTIYETTRQITIFSTSSKPQNLIKLRGSSALFTFSTLGMDLYIYVPNITLNPEQKATLLVHSSLSHMVLQYNTWLKAGNSAASTHCSQCTFYRLSPPHPLNDETNKSHA
jgi:hypothetical protein